MRLVVGLGNPAPRYSHTRHNIGSQVLVKAADTWGIPRHNAAHGLQTQLGPLGHLGWSGKGSRESVEVILAGESAWMNRSGQAVAALLDHYGIPIEDLVVVHDDLDLAMGRIRIRRAGGAGGHNGVLSLLTTLGTDQFCRLKFGIGRPVLGEDPSDYVLAPFSEDDLPHIATTIDRAVDALDCLLVQGLDAAMNRFNLRDPGEP